MFGNERMGAILYAGTTNTHTHMQTHIHTTCHMAQKTKPLAKADCSTGANGFVMMSDWIPVKKIHAPAHKTYICFVNFLFNMGHSCPRMKQWTAHSISIEAAQQHQTTALNKTIMTTLVIDFCVVLSILSSLLACTWFDVSTLQHLPLESKHAKISTKHFLCNTQMETDIMSELCCFKQYQEGERVLSIWVKFYQAADSRLKANGQMVSSHMTKHVMYG